MSRRLTVDPIYEAWFSKYSRKWNRCTRCPLHGSTRRRVLVRGHVGFDVLFVGEAPGESEDVLGWPFVGPAGKLLDHILERALGGGIRYLITNCVVCTPPRVDGKIREPHKDEKDTCQGHIRELIKKFKPMLTVSLGDHANKSMHWTEHHHMIHPAALLRYPDNKADIAVNECVDKLHYLVQQAVPPF